AFALAGLAGACLMQAGTGAADVEVTPDLRVEVVVVGIPRPVQLALDGAGHLVVLSHGWRGDAAGEVYHFDLDALPVDASHAPRAGRSGPPASQGRPRSAASRWTGDRGSSSWARRTATASTASARAAG